jgi:hypothetical protein
VLIGEAVQEAQSCALNQLAEGELLHLNLLSQISYNCGISADHADNT